MKTLISIFCLLITTALYSQEAPPTLSFGLDKVLFGKGVIDVDLLTDIIAEKQDELKARIIEQEILEPVFKNTSFATKNYVFSVVRDLLHEKDKNVLKKQVMEQTVNYAVVYAIAELFVANSDEETLCEIIGDDAKRNHKIKENFTSSLFSTRKWKLPWISNVDVRFGRQDDFMDDTDYDGEKISKSLSKNMFGLNENKVDSVAFNDLLMDCILQSIISNDKLKNRGFLDKPFYFNLEQFQSMSYYHRFKDNPVTDSLYNKVDQFVNDIANLYESFELLEKYLLDYNNEGYRDEVSFNFTKFSNEIEEQLELLSENLREAQIRSIDDEINRIQNDSSNVEILKASKVAYTQLVNELSVNYSISNPEKYYGSTENLKNKLSTVKDNLEKDSIALQAAVYWGNLSLLKEHRGLLDFNLDDQSLSDAEKMKSVRKTLDLQTEKLEDLREKHHAVSKFDNLIFNDKTLDKKANEISNLKTESIQALQEIKKSTSINTLSLNYLLDELQNELFKVADSAGLKTTPAEDAIIENLFKTYYFVKYDQKNALNLGYIAYLHHEVLPTVQALNMKAKGNLSNVSRIIEHITLLMEYKIVGPLLDQLKDPDLSEQFNNIFNSEERELSISFILRFFEHLDRLDEIDTYYYLLEQIKVAGEQCDNRDVSNAISLITQNVEKYSKFETETERIDLNVELIIDALYNRYGNRDKNPLNFHLTLGLNNAFALNDQSLVDATGSSIRNLGYASEKIGIRLNIFNFAMRHTYLQGESKPRRPNKKFDAPRTNYAKEPLISNIHWMLYGSGFLYQLADVGTTKDIQATFVGSGFGTTFYNNLNFNLSYLLPIQYDGSTKLENGAINVGFDIYFGEYITALNKKRKANKKAKLAAKYAAQRTTNTTVFK